MIINVTEEKITPSKAVAYLTMNKTNRPVSSSNINFLVNQMKNGMWQPNNGEMIKFDEDGFLIDGQHRLKSVVLANVCISTMVVRGISRNAFETIDSGKCRNAADTFALKGVLNYTHVASVTNLVYGYEQTKPDFFRNSRRVPNRRLLDCLDANPEIIDAVQATISDTMLRSVASPTITGFCFFIFAQKNKVDAHNFMESLSTGANLPKESPILLLRNRLISEKLSQTTIFKQRTIIALIFKTWNAYRTNKTIKVLKFTENGDVKEFFPVPV